MILEKTITTVFMVRTIGLEPKKVEKFGFINAYLKDESAEIECKDCIFLAFRPSNETEFNEFIAAEKQRTKLFFRHYSYPCGIKMLVYKLDLRLAADFEHVRKGRYSETSKEYQALFPKTVTIKDIFGFKKEEIALQYRIFNKTADLKKFWEDRIGVKFSEDQELWPGMSMEKETFHVNRFLVAQAS